jgi:maltooligosyltrehalose trehalohydrolase
MGEEWAASTPFPFFCDFHGDLSEAVRLGRLEQFTTPEQRNQPCFLATVPDPLAETTFKSAKLRWEEAAEEEHAAMLDFYRHILAIRRQHIFSLLEDFPEKAGAYTVHGPGSLEVWWTLKAGVLRLEANLSQEPAGCLPKLDGVICLQGSLLKPDLLGAWSVRWSFSTPSDNERG